jgi:hypothetical protein
MRTGGNRRRPRGTKTNHQPPKGKALRFIHLRIV